MNASFFKVKDSSQIIPISPNLKIGISVEDHSEKKGLENEDLIQVNHSYQENGLKAFVFSC